MGPLQDQLTKACEILASKIEPSPSPGTSGSSSPDFEEIAGSWPGGWSPVAGDEPQDISRSLLWNYLNADHPYMEEVVDVPSIGELINDAIHRFIPTNSFYYVQLEEYSKNCKIDSCSAMGIGSMLGQRRNIIASLGLKINTNNDDADEEFWWSKLAKGEEVQSNEFIRAFRLVIETRVMGEILKDLFYGGVGDPLMWLKIHCGQADDLTAGEIDTYIQDELKKLSPRRK